MSKEEPFDEIEKFIIKACGAHEEALDLLSAVTQADGRVSDVLWNQIQAFLRRVES